MMGSDFLWYNQRMKYFVMFLLLYAAFFIVAWIFT
jgi:hypothetical protein